MTDADATLPTSGWISLNVPSNELRIDPTLEAGQSFQWRKTGGMNEWSSVLCGRLVTLKQTENDILFRVYAPGVEAAVAENLRDYFQLHQSLESLYKAWGECDLNFKKKAAFFQGIRVLRQDPVETVFSFICTSNNNISRITGMIDRLCERFGTFVGRLPNHTPGTSSVQTLRCFYTFPSLSALATDGMDAELRAMGFGYRGKFVEKAAKKALEKGGDAWLKSLRNVSYKEAKVALLELNGVGPKVADCVCLMCLDKAGAIPVDTHVWQIAKRDYKLGGITTKTLTAGAYDMVGDKFREIFGSHAGWAHSVLFTADLRQFSDRDTKVSNKKRRTVIEEEIEEITTVAREKENPGTFLSVLSF
ncbi:hypothetical protein SeMB42_g01776 [Synchytrium endobioticum]|uniref:DNA-(apurinic or apyrimidinic site) lyase n=1 Tax=Synchytrium endobioticum TaxID=286115 RepID=A0A507DL43_9FUNG|nr:hypothetical protein SeLEV6574_g02209 [Synchytrium endobioticum]TPX51917.1 hypothetical protein SeMB42_g01776 [Synchytrium endobioticum]